MESWRADPRSLLDLQRGADGVVRLSPRRGHGGLAWASRFRRVHESLTGHQLAGLGEVTGFQAAGPTPQLLLRDPGGMSLAELVCEAQPIGPFLDLATGLVRALASLHDTGLLARLLSPESFILDAETGQPVLVDVGYARPFHLAGSTAAGELDGDAAWRAPEQLRGSADRIERPADLYALGVLLYQLLTGHLPFRATNRLTLAREHAAAEPAELVGRLGPGREGLARVVLKLLEKDPGRRYQDCEALLEDLERCQRMLVRDGRVPAFPLDIRRGGVRLPTQHDLLGREAELAILRSALERAGDGHPVTLALTGPAGIGKSALLARAGTAAVDRGGLLGSGRVDLATGGGPLSPLTGALTALTDQLLAGGSHRVERMLEELGELRAPARHLLVTLVPGLAHLLPAAGETADQPPGPERRRQALVSLLSALARVAAPTVLILDDLHRSRPEARRVVAELSAADIPGLALLLGWRDEPGGSGDSFAAWWASAGLPDAAIHLVVPPLRAEDSRALIAGTLSFPVDGLDELNDVIRVRAAGNPLSMGALLQRAAQGGALTFDDAGGAWTVDPAALADLEATEGAARLLEAAVHGLSDAARDALQAAACWGGPFQAEEIAQLAGRPREEVDDAFDEALSAGVLALAGRSRADEPRTLRFLHDRLQSAALAAGPTERPVAIHRRLGLQLVHALGDPPEPGAVIEAVQHLNRGWSGSDDAAHDATWNLRAAGAAQRLGSHELAAAFAATGLERAAVADVGHPTLVRTLRTEAMWTAVRLGDHERVMELAALVHRDAATPDERTDAWEATIEVHVARNRPADALAVYRDAARTLGGGFPEEPGGADVLLSLIRASLASGSLDEQRLAALPFVRRADAPPLLRVAFRATPAAYSHSGEAHGTLACDLLREGLKAGQSAGLAWGLGNYAVFQRVLFGRLEAAWRLGQSAMAMFERLRPHPWESQARAVWYVAIAALKQPLRSTLTPLREGYALGLLDGEPLHACIDAAFYVAHLTLSGEPLERVLQEGQELVDAMRARNQDLTAAVAGVFVEAARALQEPARDPLLRGPTLDTVALLAELEADPRWPLVVFYIHAARTLRATLAGDDEAAVVHARAGRAMAMHGAATEPEAHFWFYAAVAAARAGLGGAAGQRREGRRWLRRALKQARPRHKLCPEDWSARLHALEGLELLCRGHAAPSIAVLERAQRAAAESGALHEQALILELTARAYRAVGATDAAVDSLRKAISAYEAWGGRVRADALRASTFGTTAPSAVERRRHRRDHDLDAEALETAQQALARSRDPEETQRALLQLVVERAAAEHGALLLVEEDLVELVAEWTPRGPRSVERRRLDRGCPVSEAAVRLALRTGEPVLLDDASCEGSWADDPWLSAKHVRSMLCVPLVDRGHSVGVLYVEHRQVAGAFRPALLPGLRLLGALALGQAARMERLRLLAGRTEALALARDEALAYRDRLEDRAPPHRRPPDAARELKGWVLEALSEAVCGLDREGRVVVANPAAEALLGVHGDELRGTAFHARFHGGGDPGPCGVCRGVPSPGGVETTFLTQGGERIPVEVVAQAVDQDGFDVSRLLSFRHIGGRQAEQARKQQEQKQEAIGQFVAGVAHEFNNLLTPMMGHLDWLESGELEGGERATAMHDMATASRRAAGLVEQLLAFGRRSDVFRAPLELSAMLTAERQALEAEVADGVSVRWELGRGGSWVAADRRQVLLAVSHLLRNAAEALEDGSSSGSPPQIAVRLRSTTLATLPPGARGGSPGSWVELSVEDNGPGIEAQHRARMFDPFFTTRAIGQRKGLGLSVVLGVVEQHEGWIAVSRRPGGGTVLKLFFPPCEAVVEGAADGAAAAEAVSDAPRKVLVIDDEDVVRRVAALVLQRSGFVVEQAASGELGLEAVQTADAPYALILLDLSMPGIDGWEVLHRLRESGNDVPVLLISGFSLDGDAEARSARADGFLAKPFKARQLVAAVEGCLESRAAAQAT